jgi:hypothetical protein
MVDLFNGIGSAIPENRASLRAAHDHGSRCRVTLRSQKVRLRLLGCDDIVGHSTYFVVTYPWGAARIRRAVRDHVV